MHKITARSRWFEWILELTPPITSPTIRKYNPRIIRKFASWRTMMNKGNITDYFAVVVNALMPQSVTTASQGYLGPRILLQIVKPAIP